jgi:cytoskeleton protein RodZ
MAQAKPKALQKAPKSKDAPLPERETGHIGDTLREAREARDLTVENISDELMIRRFYLEALEQGNFKDLPERVYATGFVRSYAQFVGLDPVEASEQFKRDAYGSRTASYRVELTMPEPVIQSVMPSRTAMLSAVVAIILVAIGIFFATRGNMPAPASIPEAPAAADIPEAPMPPASEEAAFTGAMPAPSETGTPAPATAETAPAAETATPAPVEAGIFLEALQSSWLEVKDAKGTVLFTNILKQGQKLPIPDQPGITVTTGNAGGLRMVVNGQPQAALGAANEVKRNMPLNTGKL